MIVQVCHVAFTDVGTSGILGGYDSHYLASLNINSHSTADPFTPIPKYGSENTLASILSVSGETNEMIKQMTDFKTTGAKTLSIANNQYLTIVHLTNCNISCHMSDKRSPFVDKLVNTTAQIPVIALIELLAHQASQLLRELDETPL